MTTERCKECREIYEVTDTKKCVCDSCYKLRKEKKLTKQRAKKKAMRKPKPEKKIYELNKLPTFYRYQCNICYTDLCSLGGSDTAVRHESCQREYDELLSEV